MSLSFLINLGVADKQQQPGLAGNQVESLIPKLDGNVESIGTRASVLGRGKSCERSASQRYSLGA